LFRSNPIIHFNWGNHQFFRPIRSYSHKGKLGGGDHSKTLHVMCSQPSASSARMEKHKTVSISPPGWKIRDIQLIDPPTSGCIEIDTDLLYVDLVLIISSISKRDSSVPGKHQQQPGINSKWFRVMNTIQLRIRLNAFPLSLSKLPKALWRKSSPDQASLSK